MTRILRERLAGDIRWLGFILVIALAARLAWVLWVELDPEKFPGDSRVYHLLAVQISDGCGYCDVDGEAAIFFPPGYPSFLGILYWVFGSNAAVGQAANIFLTTLNAGLVFLIVRRIDPNAALVSAGLYAFLPSNAMFSSLTYSEPLFTTLLLTTMILALRGTSPIILGVLIGLSTLVRGQGILLIVPVAVVTLMRMKWRASLRQHVLPTVIVALIVLAPWTVRNYAEFDKFIFVSTGHAETLWRGNREGVTGPPRPPVFPEPTGQDPIDVYEAKLEESVRWIQNNPVTFFVTLPPRKLYYMYESDDFQVWTNRAASSRRDNDVAWSVITRITDFGYFGLLALAAISAPLWLRRTPESMMLLATFAAWTFFHLVFFGYSRFHFPVMPVLAIWAGAGITAIWHRDKRPDGGS